MNRLEGLGAIPRVAVHLPADDANAVVTLTAPTDGSRHVVDWISWSYDTATTAVETLTVVITQAGTAITLTWYIPIAAAGTAFTPQHLVFPQPIVGDPNTVVTITLTVDGAASQGALNVGYR